MTLGTTELSLIDRWQRNFPLTERPFTLVGNAAGLAEAEAIDRFVRLQEAGVISRIGAVVKPNTVGASTLAAMRVPQQRLEDVAAVVSREPLVNHNYERTHAINLWFVIAGPDTESVAGTISRIERQSGLAVLNLPLLQAYHIDLGFPLAGEGCTRDRSPGSTAGRQPDSLDRTLLATIEDGLPLVARPYHSIAERLGVGENDVLDRLRQLTLSGVVKRFGCVVRHRTIGYEANAMAVWDIADEDVDDIADLFTSNPSVTLCYRRQRHFGWPYNLFCMVHAKSRSKAYAAIDDLNLIADTGLNPQAVLFSTRCFKQRGAMLSNPTRGNE
jgi:siroheme decarboxylase